MSDPVKCPACGQAMGSEHDRLHGLGDRDQTLSDEDQTWSDHDQTASDRDQRSTDDDQRTSDAEFAVGGSDPSAHALATAARRRSTADRAAVSEMREATATTRLQSADERDRAAELRDRGAAGRDRLAALHDSEDPLQASREELVLRAQRDRARAAADRAKAADDRRRAAADREYAARERTEAADQIELATTDELTGAWVRQFGLLQVTREIERAHRTGGRLVLVFVDVDGLKAVNDSRGHSAGDALLRCVGHTLRATVRAYDVIVRYGGDEFVCAMPNMTTAAAKARFERASAAVAAACQGRSFTFGVAEIEQADGLSDLVARSDAALMHARRSHRAGQ